MDNGLVTPATEPAIGETVNFICPGIKILSDDKDNFNEFDNAFSLLCTVVERYKAPTTWPECNTGCSRELPTPPPESGMHAITPNLEVGKVLSTCIPAVLLMLPFYTYVSDFLIY